MDDVIAYHPSFYRTGLILQREVGNLVVSVKGKQFELDGRSEPIYAANDAAGLQITEDTVAEYLRFFSGNLQGRDARVPDEDFKAMLKKDPFALRYRIASEPEILDAEGDEFLLESLVQHAGQMFEVVFVVHKEGFVKMLRDEPLGMVE